MVRWQLGDAVYLNQKSRVQLSYMHFLKETKRVSCFLIRSLVPKDHQSHFGALLQQQHMHFIGNEKKCI